MPQLKDTPVAIDDIREFAEASSDFGFELRTLTLLKSRGIDCEHGGTYVDPVTSKPRQFDIRALIDHDSMRIRLAIECKNLRENYPLVVFEVPRTAQESYHTVIYARQPQFDPSSHRLLSASTFVLRGEHSFYSMGEYVGKSCTQVGRTPKGDLTGNDAEVYEKWDQAIQSSHELIDIASRDWMDASGQERLVFVLPVLVVPDGRLWRVRYTPEGVRKSDPELVNRTTIYLGKAVLVGPMFYDSYVTISHLEVVNETGLAALCEGLLRGELLAKAFDTSGMK